MLRRNEKVELIKQVPLFAHCSKRELQEIASIADEPNADPARVVWPDFVQRAGGDVRKLYEFQLVNGELMKYMPCFCGCGRTSGHKSNRDCYVQQVRPDGSVAFDAMAPT